MNAITQETLKELNKMVIVTGRLSEIHVKNLETYPFLVFNNLSSVEISYDIVTDSQLVDGGAMSVISFRIFPKKKIKKNTLELGVKTLTTLVHGLMWSTIRVELYYGRSNKPVSVKHE